MNLAENIQKLRKEQRLSQDQLAEALEVSRQSISKWELGLALPDITMLPKLSQYFHVSTDALLGLVPLEETYRPSNSGTKEYWAGRVDYLKRTRKTMWNADYMEFLIQQVWHLDKPVNILDCGCGYGALGLLLLPLLPKGSTYTGLDFSKEMLQEGEKIYQAAGLNAKWILTDILDFSPKESYDLVISQALLRHVNDGERYLKKMIGFAGQQGLVVTMECNREFEADGLYIQGMDYAALCQHEGLKKLWRTELQMQNRDYSIAMKIPHLMKKHGLRDIGCRMNDRVTFLEPEQDDYTQTLLDIAGADHWILEKSTQETEQDIAYFMNHGMSRKDAEDYCRQQNSIVQYLKQNAGKAALTKVTGVLITYGRK